MSCMLTESASYTSNTRHSFICLASKKQTKGKKGQSKKGKEKAKEKQKEKPKVKPKPRDKRKEKQKSRTDKTRGKDESVQERAETKEKPKPKGKEKAAEKGKEESKMKGRGKGKMPARPAPAPPHQETATGQRSMQMTVLPTPLHPEEQKLSTHSTKNVVEKKEFKLRSKVVDPPPSTKTMEMVSSASVPIRSRPLSIEPREMRTNFSDLDSNSEEEQEEVEEEEDKQESSLTGSLDELFGSLGNTYIAACLQQL